MIYYNEKAKKKGELSKVLYNEIFNFKKDVNKFIIITGYTGPQMIKDLANLPYEEIVVVIGMYGKNINPKLHQSIINCNTSIKNLSVYYTNKEVHTKCYAWYKNDKMVDFLIGSANFSPGALIGNAMREVLCKVSDSQRKDEMEKYIKSILKDTYICNALKANDIEKRKVPYSSESCKLSLLASRKGDTNIIEISTEKNNVHAAAGLNWGYSVGTPALNDAYIAIRKNNIEEAPGLFPIKSSENKPIEVVWDDGTINMLLLESNGSKASDSQGIYPKSIGSFRNKSELGDYLRKRIGEKIDKDLIFTPEAIATLKSIKEKNTKKIGNNRKSDKAQIIKDIKQNKKLYEELKSKIITKEDLIKYGRMDITVTMIGDGIYSFDFSV